jgi:hypothetical protein
MKKLLFFILFVGFAGLLNAQNIIAGQHSTSDYYYDYIPDTIIQQAYPGGDFYIDINNDGINDFKFHLDPGSGALGWQSHSAYISALNNNEIVLAYNDTCKDTNQVYLYNRGMARAFNNSDTINSTAKWVNKVYLEYLDSHYLGYSCSGSYGVNPAYVGLKVIKWTDTLYAWVEIKSWTVDYYSSIYYLTLGSYACNKGNVGLQQISFNSSECNIYPNPSADNLTIETMQKSEIEILNIEGQILKSIAANDNTTTIDVSSFARGMYFVKVKSEKGIAVNKFIKE